MDDTDSETTQQEPHPDSSQLATPSHLGRFRIDAELGRGGMGVVFRAHDPELDRPLALKVLQGSSRRARERFLAEARAQARVRHPHLCQIYETGIADGMPFIAMQLVEGPSLATAPELSLDETVAILTQVAAAVGTAHRAGLIHRDLKPANILLERDEEGKWCPFVGDFGVARTIGEPGLTATGSVLGTPHYMSPEQASGSSPDLDARTDVWSLGATLFRLLTDRPLFEGPTGIAVMVKLAYEEPPALATFRPDLPAELDRIVGRCLARDLDARYPSAVELAQDLSAFAQISLPSATSSRVTPRSAGRRVRRGWLVALALAALVLAAITVAVLRTVPGTPPSGTESLAPSSADLTLDTGWGLLEGDLGAVSPATLGLTRRALAADAEGRRSLARTLMESAHRSDPRTPIPALLLAQWQGDDQGAAEDWLNQATTRLGGRGSEFESHFLAYARSQVESDPAAQAGAVSALLELRPDAWRLRLRRAHQALALHELDRALPDLQAVRFTDLDDHRLVIVLCDRASLGDAAGVAQIADSLPDSTGEAHLAFVRGCVAAGRGEAGEARLAFERATAAARVAGLTNVEWRAVLRGALSAMEMGDADAAARDFDALAILAQELGIWETAAIAAGLGSYLAWRRGDSEGRDRRFQTAIELMPDTLGDERQIWLPLVGLWIDAVDPEASVPVPLDSASRAPFNGVGDLVQARAAWARGDLEAARAALDRATRGGVDDTWFEDEADLLRLDLGLPATLSVPTTPYPATLRFAARWEVARRLAERDAP